MILFLAISFAKSVCLSPGLLADSALGEFLLNEGITVFGPGASREGRFNGTSAGKIFLWRESDDWRDEGRAIPDSVEIPNLNSVVVGLPLRYWPGGPGSVSMATGCGGLAGGSMGCLLGCRYWFWEPNYLTSSITGAFAGCFAGAAIGTFLEGQGDAVARNEKTARFPKRLRELELE